MSRLSVHREARKELRKTVLYYRDEASAAVALEFIEIYDAAIQDILESPRSNPVFLGKFYRKVRHKFPYSLYHKVTAGGVRLFAVSHQKRKPFYWLGRS